jgi:phosphoenolpyruvate synthase/pyruvate phosphate dikinase
VGSELRKATTNEAHVLPLSAAGAAEAVGGKAAGFAILAAAGLDFPDGFVLGAEAHRRARSLGWTAGTPIPATTSAAVSEALAFLPGEAFAVRSSAIAEDGASASFAGQFETIVGVNREDIATAIAECWGSAWNGRALAYRTAERKEHAMAVIVQPLVDADVSGVVVTVDPITGDERTLLVNASFGLGEAVVSGLVTPDEYRIARADGCVVAAMIEAKELEIVRGLDGALEQRELPIERSTAATLDAEQLRALWQGALAAEAVLGRPADLEFAFADGRLLWLQCRPLTALPTKED